MRRKSSQSRNIKGRKLRSKGLSTRAQVSPGPGDLDPRRGSSPRAAGTGCCPRCRPPRVLGRAPGDRPPARARARPAPSTASAEEGQPQGHANAQHLPQAAVRAGAGLFSRSGGFGTDQACGDLLRPQTLPTRRPCCAQRRAPPWAGGPWAQGRPHGLTHSVSSTVGASAVPGASAEWTRVPAASLSTRCHKGLGGLGSRWPCPRGPGRALTAQSDPRTDSAARCPRDTAHHARTSGGSPEPSEGPAAWDPPGPSVAPCAPLLAPSQEAEGLGRTLGLRLPTPPLYRLQGPGLAVYTRSPPRHSGSISGFSKPHAGLQCPVPLSGTHTYPHGCFCKHGDPTESPGLLMS